MDSENLPITNSESEADLVSIALKTKDQRTRTDVITALQAKASRQVFETARKLCLSKNEDQCLLGLEILSGLGAPELIYPVETVDVIEKLLSVENSSVIFGAAAQILARIADRKAVSLLYDLHKNPKSEIRYGVVLAIGYFLRNYKHHQILSMVLNLLQDDDHDIRFEAAAFLANHNEIIEVEVRQALNKRTEDLDPAVRGQALLGLVRRKDPAAFDLLFKELKLPQIAVGTLFAVAELKDTRLYPVLVQVGKWWNLDKEALSYAMDSCKPE